MKASVTIGMCVLSLTLLPGDSSGRDDRPKSRLTISEHTGTVLSVTFNPSGKYVASGGSDETVRFWDAKTGKRVGYIPQSGGAVSLAYSPDGGLFAVSTTMRLAKKLGGEIHVWNLDEKKHEGKLDGFGGSVVKVNFSPDGKRVHAADHYGFIVDWNLAGKVDRPSIGRVDGALVYAFSPDAKVVASAEWPGKEVHFWDAGTHKRLATLEGHKDEVSALAFRPDGKLVASGSKDKSIIIWDATTRKVVTTLTGHTKDVDTVAFSPDGKLLASGSEDNTVRVWNLATSKCIATFDEHKGYISQVAFSPDGKSLASCSKDETVKIWDVPEVK